MPGRKQPKRTESERDRLYRISEKRSHGDHVVGERAEDIEDKGAVAEVRRERAKWAEERERLSRRDM